jgi:hypothetical protein
MTHKLWSNHKWIEIKLVFQFLVIKHSIKRSKLVLDKYLEKLDFMFEY